MLTYRIVYRDGHRTEGCNRRTAIRNARRADALRVELLCHGTFLRILWASTNGGGAR